MIRSCFRSFYTQMPVYLEAIKDAQYLNYDNRINMCQKTDKGAINERN